jgi:CO/xanthine dehydrogenase FAD-binding subunit
LLVTACSVVGAAQIQNRGTLGGNIANASPAGDTFPPLAVYEAVVHCAGPAGRRTVSIHEIFAGVKKTTLKPGELIAAIELPFPAKPPTRAVFRKVGTRAAQSISKTMFAGLLWLAKDGTVADARLSFGSLAPTVKRLRSAEKFLAGRRLDAAAAAGAAALLTDDVSPIDDIRSTRDYRLEASRNLLVRFLEGAQR